MIMLNLKLPTTKLASFILHSHIGLVCLMYFVFCILIWTSTCTFDVRVDIDYSWLIQLLLSCSNPTLPTDSAHFPVASQKLQGCKKREQATQAGRPRLSISCQAQYTDLRHPRDSSTQCLPPPSPNITSAAWRHARPLKNTIFEPKPSSPCPVADPTRFLTHRKRSISAQHFDPEFTTSPFYDSPQKAIVRGYFRLSEKDLWLWST